MCSRKLLFTLSDALVPLTKPLTGYAQAMPKLLVTDQLWAIIEPLLPKEPPKPKGGRPRVNDRAAFTGILFVLKTGIPWEMLPQEMGCGSGMTCWRRLKEWHQAGVWKRLHRALLDRLGKADRIDWSRASLDSASVAAPGGAKRPVPARRTVANGAQSAILWSTVGASRWRSSSRRPTSTTRGCSKRHSAPSRPSADRAVALVSVRRSCMRTRATTFAAAERRYASGASRTA
jgi:transposase